jgi:nitroreductase
MNDSVQDVIKRRYSCREYVDRSVGDSEREALTTLLASLQTGPFGNPCRFALLAATADDRAALKGLGTYGFIKGATAFMLGVVRPGAQDMEDYGYLLERAVLEATDLGLGTCWLGGTFSRSSFARKINAGRHEVIPAVAALGYPAEDSRNGRLRRQVGAERRLPPADLFFDGHPGAPLDPTSAGDLSPVLEAVRWAPSASNKQPWRLIRTDAATHFYLQRTRGYGKGPLMSLLRMADLQRVDMGIAMCHFDLAAREAGIDGHWAADRPLPGDVTAGLEYIASWVS